MIPFEVEDLGLLSFAEAVAVQKQVLEDVLVQNRSSTLILVEHPPVLTLGANFHSVNLKHPEDWYRSRDIQIEKTDRGGDVTYHAPGQLVAYPIFALGGQGRDLHRWLRQLEEAVLLTVESFGIVGRRFAPHTGVWVGDRKICAIGIKVRRWVSMHGIALNCDNDLAPFQWIVPCGIEGYGVTSVQRETGHDSSVAQIKPRLVEGFREVFR